MDKTTLLAGPHIGSDETLKGDTFGGIVVCACYSEGTEDFLGLGVKDSKKLTNEQIAAIATQLLKQYPQKFAWISLEPKHYNELLRTHNQTQLLNKLHEQVARDLWKRFGKVPFIVDKFPGCIVGDVAQTQAETLSLAVAAASIVARQKGMEQFAMLRKRAGFTLPLGSTHVAQALSQIIASGKSPSLFVKLHFKNVQQALRHARKGQKTLRDDF
ncbi:hypothetical protein K9M74_02115 [Candidatus Woesearchaeota archaeon]|nr:hypothetical protein [Candidatus Woesearchaeota archaeon]